MYGDEPEDIFYYITLYNENYPMPAMPEGVEDGHRPRPVPLPGAPERAAQPGRVQLIGSGPILQQALAAQQLFAEHFDVAADVWGRDQLPAAA